MCRNRNVAQLILVSLTLVVAQEVTNSFQQMDSPVSQMQWCGASVVFTRDDEAIEQTHDETRKVIFVLSDDGRIWRSIDYGQTWHNVQDTFEKMADDKLYFESIQISPADSRVIYFFSSNGKSFKSKDCGRTYTQFSHQPELYDFKLNKMDEKWIMAFKDKPCGKKDINCREYYKKSIYVTRDGGDTWLSVLNYVREASWDKLLQYQMVPDERILVCHMKDGKSAVSYSDDYFNTTNVMKEDAQGYFQTSYYIFVLSKPDPFSDGFELLISPAYLDKFIPQDVKLPISSLSQHSYTILDTSEGQIFLSVSHDEDNLKLTNIYVSDFRGFKFTLSLLHNVRSLDTGNCDFERVLGIEGVYIANVYDHHEVEKLKGREQVQQHSLEPYKKSYISYDKGGNWHPLRAPEVDADGKEVVCSGDCSLHLKGRTESNQNPIYSSENSPGVAIGVGNTGLYLTQRDSEVNTYLTRDGGHTWYEIRKGSHMYEIGDRGGIIVMGRDDKATTSIIYSWDEGLTWEEVQISERPFMIQNIVTEPSNMELKFIVYGQSGSSETSLVGIVVALDFSTLHQRVCSGSWDPTMPESDYEFWIPRNFENGKCIFGRKMKYIRRKREVQCFNQEELDRKYFLDTCSCVDDDWECDYGFFRQIEGGPCTPISKNFEDDDIPDVLKPPPDCRGTYMLSQGYRKVSGDYCMGGIDLGPVQTECPKNETSSAEEPPLTGKATTTGSTNQPARSNNITWAVISVLIVIVLVLAVRDRVQGFIVSLLRKPEVTKGVKLNRKNYEQISLFQKDEEDEP